MSQTIQVLLGAESRCCYIFAYRPYSGTHLPALILIFQKQNSVILSLFFHCFASHQPTLTQKTLETILHSKADGDKCLSMHMLRLLICAYLKNVLWRLYPRIYLTVLLNTWCWSQPRHPRPHWLFSSVPGVSAAPWLKKFSCLPSCLHEPPNSEVWVHMSKK